MNVGGFIHLLLEGYFACNFRRMVTMQDLLGQLWKEYSLSDARYQTQNAFVLLCMETITRRLLGSAVLHRRLHDHDESSPPIPAPGCRFAWATLRRCAVLRD